MVGLREQVEHDDTLELVAVATEKDGISGEGDGITADERHER